MDLIIINKVCGQCLTYMNKKKLNGVLNNCMIFNIILLMKYNCLLYIISHVYIVCCML